MHLSNTPGFRLPRGIVRSTTVDRTTGYLLALMVLVATTLRGAPTEAHTFDPATIDISIEGDRAHLEIGLFIEAVLADLDLRYLDDQGDKEKIERYTALRIVAPAQVKSAFHKAWPDIAPRIHVAVQGKDAPLQVEYLAIPDDGPPDRMRMAKLVLTAMLPPGTAPITFSWARSLGPAILSRTIDGKKAYVDMLLAGASSKPLDRRALSTPTSWETFIKYLGVGFAHIIPHGLDHILFVIGLFFYSTGLKTLLFQVTTFTIAHSITLALSTLALLSVPSSLVEPLIAASIVYVSLENIWGTRNPRWRLLVVFCFGLLHGLGFASALSEFGLNNLNRTVALAGFNLGVEAGQIAVLGLAYLTVGYWFSDFAWYRDSISNPASFLIGLTGLYWFIERL